MTTARSALIEWAKKQHRQLGERIQKGTAVKAERAEALINDLKWRQAVLNAIITATANWDAPQLAGLALRLCVRMPVEFCEDKLYKLASEKDIDKRDAILARVGDVDIAAHDQTAAKEQLYPLIQEAAAFAFETHEWVYREWFAAAA